MKGISNRPRRAFTLIELLVVVAIIALLISILLPSLAAAREQGKVAKCLSNLRGIAQATNAYLLDWEDAYPFVVTVENPTDPDNPGKMGICSWSYAGKTNDAFWQTDPNNSIFYVPLRERPMNRYLLGSTPQADLMNGNTVVKRTEVELTKCPSDKSAYQRFWGNAKADALGMACYDDVGTSYQYNLNSMLRGTSSDVFKDGLSADNWAWKNLGEGWQMLSRALLNDAMLVNPSTYELYHEDPMDWAMGNRIERIGNHGKLSKHSLSFIDGHAENKKIDTRGYCGTGWQSLDTQWIWYPNRPRPSPFYYSTYSPRNCDPVP